MLSDDGRFDDCRRMTRDARELRAKGPRPFSVALLLFNLSAKISLIPEVRPARASRWIDCCARKRVRPVFDLLYV